MMIGYFLPGIIILGLITSYEDIRSGKIRNKWIIPGLLYALIINLILIFLHMGTINIHYTIELLTNFIFAIIIGFGFWYLGIWTAGDGKLFIAFAALIPLSAYSYGYMEWTPSIALLINVLLPATLMLFVYIIFKVNFRLLKTVMKKLAIEIFEHKRLLASLISIFAIIWVIGILMTPLRLESNFIIRLALTYIVMAKLQAYLKARMVYIMLSISILRMIFDRSIWSIDALVQLVIITFIWHIVRSFLKGGLSKLGYEIFSKEVDASRLKPGMILAEVFESGKEMSEKEIDMLKKMPDIEVIKHGKRHYVKKPKSFIDIDRHIDEAAEGITKEHINEIKRLGFKRVRVTTTLPFAPLIFVGALLTIMAKGNILIVLRNIF